MLNLTDEEIDSLAEALEGLVKQMVSDYISQKLK
jgi:hypothetical protein